MFLVVYNLNSWDLTIARQLNFNHRVVKVQTENKSAVKMGGFDNVCVSIVLRNIFGLWFIIIII